MADLRNRPGTFWPPRSGTAASGSEANGEGAMTVGCTTSSGCGGYLHRLLAPCPVETGMYEMGTELEVAILGEFCKVTVVEVFCCDPQNVKLRA